VQIRLVDLVVTLLLAKVAKTDGCKQEKAHLRNEETASGPMSTSLPSTGREDPCTFEKCKQQLNAFSGASAAQESKETDQLPAMVLSAAAKAAADVKPKLIAGAYPDGQGDSSILRIQGLAQGDAELSKGSLALCEDLSQKLRCKSLHTGQLKSVSVPRSLLYPGHMT
jgi:hypothetical protein